MAPCLMKLNFCLHHIPILKGYVQDSVLLNCMNIERGTSLSDRRTRATFRVDQGDILDRQIMPCCRLGSGLQDHGSFGRMHGELHVFPTYSCEVCNFCGLLPEYLLQPLFEILNGQAVSREKRIKADTVDGP